MTESPHRHFLTIRRGLWPASIVLLGAAVLAVLRRLPLALHGKDLFSDDAYYYIVTARNFVETGRFTFDGLSETNGFHPLLFWLEAAGFALFGTGADPLGLYQAVFCSMVVLFLLTIGGVFVAVHASSQSKDESVLQAALLAAIAVVLVPRFTKPYLGGMEAVLVLPLLILVGALAWRRCYGLAGFAALLLVMARLDSLPYLVGPLAVACAWRERGEGLGGMLRGLLVLLAPVVGTLLFMVFNQWYFGHPMPIHGVLKGCFPRIHWQPYQVFDRPSDAATMWFVIAAAVGSIVLLLPKGRAGSDARGAGLLAAGLCVVQLAAFVLFQKWSKQIPVWYLGPSMLAAVFALAVGIGNLFGLRRLRGAATVVAAAALLLNLVSVGRAWQQGLFACSTNSSGTTAEAAAPGGLVDFMRQQPEDCIWACTDCGKLAFWSERRVVNLDGLINDFAYQEALRDGRLAEYLREKNVRYLVFIAWDRPQLEGRIYEPMYECRVTPDVFADEYDQAKFRVVSYQYWTYSDTILLPRQSEVWRSAQVQDGHVMSRAVVFDLDVALAAKR